MSELNKKHLLERLGSVVANKRWSSSQRQEEIECIVNEYSDDKDFLINAASISGSVSKYLEDQWLSDFDIALACVKKNPGQIVDFSPEIQDRDEIVEAATEKHPFIYCLLNERHRANKDLFYKTLEHDQLNIKNFLMAPMEFRDNNVVIDVYMTKDPIQTYESMPEKYKRDENLISKYLVGKFSEGDINCFKEGVDAINGYVFDEETKRKLVATSLLQSKSYMAIRGLDDESEFFNDRKFWNTIINNSTTNNRFQSSIQDFYERMPTFLQEEIAIGINHLHKKNNTGEWNGSFFTSVEHKYTKEYSDMSMKLLNDGVKFNPGSNVFVVNDANELRKELEKKLPKLEDLINVDNLTNLPNSSNSPINSSAKKSGKLKI